MAAMATQAGNVAIGGGGTSTTLNQAAQATAAGCVAIGSGMANSTSTGAIASGTGSFAIGSATLTFAAAASTGNYGVALGVGAYSPGASSTAIGSHALGSVDCVAIGYGANWDGYVSTTIYPGYTTFAYTTAIGFFTNAKMAGGGAIGVDSNGLGATSLVANQISVGTPAQNTRYAGVLAVGQPGNLLTANQSYGSLNATTGWAAGTNTTITAVVPNTQYAGDYALFGSASGQSVFLLTAGAAGTVLATTPTGTGGVAVTASTVYSAQASVAIADAVAIGTRAVTVTIYWWTSGGVAASTASNTGSAVTLISVPNWVTATVTATSPSNAAFASVTVSVANVAGTTSYELFTCIQLNRGTSTSWVPGGTAAGGYISQVEGTLASKQGVVTLSGATTTTVSNTGVTANSRIQLTAQALAGTGGVPAALAVTAVTPGTSFVITSSVALDTSVVAYFITEPA